MDSVVILLATYNGEKYVGELIDSIISQSFQNWKLILSDDCSQDNTCKILQGYAEKMPEKMVFYQSGKRFGCAQDHFMYLLKQFSDAPYIMFCDQDDIWHFDKIEKTFRKMMETETSTDRPAMVHTDLRVVDKERDVINESFMAMSNISGNRMTTRQLLTQNVVTGCTMMINGALARLATDGGRITGLSMHDWWLALLASACGDVGYLDEATIDYRQHENNSVGAKKKLSISYIVELLRTSQIPASMRATFANAELLLACFEKKIPTEKKKIIQQYIKIGNKCAILRRIGYIRYGFWKAGCIEKIGQILMG